MDSLKLNEMFMAGTTRKYFINTKIVLERMNLKLKMYDNLTSEILFIGVQTLRK